jgi:hypothetical protein
MTASEIVNIVSRAIGCEEERAFEATVAARAAEGWANPTLQAQREWQGHDNGVVFGIFTQALSELVEYGEVPTGCDDFDPEGEAGDEAKREHLIAALSSAGAIGTGEPLAYVGVAGCFTLIRAGATVEQIEQAATSCLTSSDE